MQIIQATAKHFKEINKIAQLTWPATYGHILREAQYTMMLDWMYSIESLQKQAANGHQFFMAEHNNEFIGFSSCQHQYKNAAVTKLHKLYVLPTAQGTGAGKALMENIKLQAQQNNSTSITLNVNRFNAAKDFYLKLGYTITAEEDIDIGQGYLMEDYVMEIKL